MQRDTPSYANKGPELFSTKIQEFKIFEAFGESAPQFILQASIILNAHPTMAFSNLELREILTLSSSFISVIWTVSSTFLKLPFIVNGKKEAPFNCWKNYLFVGPLVLLIVTPRLMALAMPSRPRVLATQSAFVTALVRRAQTRRLRCSRILWDGSGAR